MTFCEAFPGLDQMEHGLGNSVVSLHRLGQQPGKRGGVCNANKETSYRATPAMNHAFNSLL
jgi:hypothetical protein